MTADPYRCGYCGKYFVVPSMTVHHVQNNQCGLVPRQAPKGKK